MSYVPRCILLAACIVGVLGQKCYVCKDQEENTGKCTTTVEPCDYGEEYCLSEIKWGSTPYWEIGAPMQHFISKRCATKEDCVETITKYMPNCLRIWWKDWTCAECCKGDRCNYYITVHTFRPRHVFPGAQRQPGRRCHIHRHLTPDARGHRGPRPCSMPGHALCKFWADWEIYKHLACVPPAETAMELYLACDDALQAAIFTSVPSLSGLSESALAALISTLVTQQQNQAAARKHFRSLTQQPGEAIRNFVTCLSQAGSDCDYVCRMCGMNQTEEHVRDQVIIGVHDTALQQDLLTKDCNLPNLAAFITRCEGFESAARDQETFRVDPTSATVHTAHAPPANIFISIL